MTTRQVDFESLTIVLWSLAAQSVPKPWVFHPVGLHLPSLAMRVLWEDHIKNFTKFGMKTTRAVFHSKVVVSSLKADSAKHDFLVANPGWLFLVTFVSLEMASIGIFFS